ncbi:MAG: flagellar biosynthetic protein FliO, partial [Clostridiales Family XIII bacterium]|jgi:hypothetical protein|nr:flagellar biosynthetic protein FliO [Clostridiales Family XIII bacterium]
MVGKTGALLLVELSGTQYLVSVSERGAEILKELDEPVEAPEAPPMPVFGLKALDFRELLEKVGVRKGGM